jgi:putative transposase
VLYTDNGLDFTSQHLEQVAADLKMRLVFRHKECPEDVAVLSASSPLSRRRFCAICLAMCRQRAVCGANQRSHFRSWTACWALFFVEVYHRRAHTETKTSPSERWEAGGFSPQNARFA